MVKLIPHLMVIIGSISISSCVEDIEEENKFHAYYTLVNKSDFEVTLKYNDETPMGRIQYDTIIKKNSSYTMEVVWDIIGPPFKWVDTLFVGYDEFKFFTTNNEHLSIVRFSDLSYYEYSEDSYYTRRGSYTITNEDYEYSKQKLAEWEGKTEDEEKRQ